MALAGSGEAAASAGAAACPLPVSRGRSLRVAAPAPFSFSTVVRSHGWYDLPPFHYDPKGRALTVTVSAPAGGTSIRFRDAEHGIEVDGGSADPEAALRAIAQRVFSLDVDLTGFAAAAAADPDLSWAVARGAGRFLRAPSLWEDAVKMLFTTNCSWAATRGMVRRLIENFGEGGAFPGPGAIARRREGTLARHVRSGYRTAPLLAFARNVDSGRLDLSRWEDARLESGEVRERIVEQPGFGPYAAEGLLRLIGRHDYFAIDSWTRMKYRKLHPGRGTIERAIARRYRRYGKFQGLAFWLDLTRDWHENGHEW